MSWRKVQAPKNPKGLALGWLIGSQADASLCAALPGWAIVLTDQAPLTVSSADLVTARALGGANAATPVGLLGWSAGVQSVRSVLVSKALQPWAVAVFDGTHAGVPPLDWQVQVWKDLAEGARLGQVRFTATATQMLYTKNIPAGQKGRAWPTSWVLGRALGLGDEGLKVGQPVLDGDLYVEVFPSPEFPRSKGEWDAAAQAHRDQINVAAPRLLAAWWGGNTSTPVAKPDQAVEPWQDPAVPLAERFARWAEIEWSRHYAETPAGSNDSPRIREYDQAPFTRDLDHDGDEDPIAAPRSAWCAKMAGAGLFHCSLGDQIPVLRVAGIEYQKDAQKAGTWIQAGTGLPFRGCLAIFSRPGDSWFRHVRIVIGCTGNQAEVIGGNEGDTIGRSTIQISGPNKDPSLLGFVRIG